MIYDCALPIASLDLIYCVYILFDNFSCSRDHSEQIVTCVARIILLLVDAFKAMYLMVLLEFPPFYRFLNNTYTSKKGKGHSTNVYIQLN